MLVLRAKGIALWPESILCDLVEAVYSGEEEDVRAQGGGAP